MPRLDHQTTLGAWFFQATIESSKLSRHVSSERAALENKPRGRRQHETGVRPTNWTGLPGADIEEENTVDDMMTILVGVRTIHGSQAGPGGEDIDIISRTGSSTVRYPQGPGLPPFKDKPVVTATYAGFGIDDVAGVAIASWQDGDLFAGGRPFTSNEEWGRVYIAPPTGTDHRGRVAVTNMRTGVEFINVHGYLNATMPPSPGQPPNDLFVKALFIHWVAMGTVEAY